MQVAQDEDAIAYLTYNDQPPVGPTVMSGGHSKGVIMTSLASGFWIQHSVPHFPLIDSNYLRYQYPNTGRVNGQVFHCISLPTSQDVDNLAKILEITNPHVVNSSFPTDLLKNALPQLVQIANRRRPHEGEENRINEESQSNRPNNESSSNTQLHPCINEVDEKACSKQLNSTVNVLTTPSNSHQTTTTNATEPNWGTMDIRSMGGRAFRAYIKGPSFHEG